MPKLESLGSEAVRTHAETVRENARELLAEAQGAKHFAERTGLSESRVSQLLGRNPTKDIGASTARRIERAFGKPIGWLDTRPDTRAPLSSIGDRLDLAMRKAGHASQAALARASGVPQPTIARVLKGTGRGGPETETIRKLAGACNVSFSWLQTGDEQGKSAERHLTAEQQAWLSLLDDLGSEDIAEFTALIHARQTRNRKLVDELIRRPTGSPPLPNS